REVRIADNYFSPSYLFVPAGTLVHWKNHGKHAHTVTCQGVWDSGPLEPGTGFSVVLTQPGTYTYYCQIHPALMRGSVVVYGIGCDGSTGYGGSSGYGGGAYNPYAGYGIASMPYSSGYGAGGYGGPATYGQSSMSTGGYPGGYGNVAPSYGAPAQVYSAPATA